ncbi:MAG: biotin/lipoyl-binding protein, partial [Oscillospiraceae bacterium]|nr:biotin/lipoyl-binding protein [Oscillospiraceae bacterium]
MNLEYDFNEIKEYSSAYDRNPGLIIPFFIGTILVFIMVFLVMIFTIDKEYVVTTQGSIQSEDTADISFPVSGKVNKVAFKEGDPVRKDDVIFEMDDSYYKSQIDQLNADHQIDLTNEKLYLKEKDCVNSVTNDFNVNDKDEAPFYYKMEVYLQSVNNLYSSKTNSNSDYQKSVIKNNALSGASKDLENAKND